MAHDSPTAALAPTGRTGNVADRDLGPADGMDRPAAPAPAPPQRRYHPTLATGTGEVTTDGDAGRPFGGAGKPDASWPRTDNTLRVENPEALDRASGARDAQIEGHGRSWARTHTAAYDVNTGEVSVGASGRGTNNCAETNARAGLPDTADEDVRYTQARGWRKNEDTGERELVEVPICGPCQDKSEPQQYPPGTRYQPDARWDLMNAVQK